jgi:hypothetical protein
VSEFEYTVVKEASGQFWVKQLPPSVP